MKCNQIYIFIHIFYFCTAKCCNGVLSNDILRKVSTNKEVGNNAANLNILSKNYWFVYFQIGFVA